MGSTLTGAEAVTIRGQARMCARTAGGQQGCSMGSYLTANVYQESLGGRRSRHTIRRGLAYRDGSAWRTSALDWANSGDPDRPHVVTAAALVVSMSGDGARRLHPTREGDRYVEIGRPYTRDSGSWQPVAFGAAMRTANRISWARPQARLDVWHAGHACKLGIELLGGYVPAGGQIAFPVGMQGLTRSGARILADGVEVAHLRAPWVEDLAGLPNPRPVVWEFATLAGQAYLVLTLPSLAGMARPYVDPTLSLPTDAVFNVDNFIQSVVGTRNAGISGLIGVVQTPNSLRGMLAPDVSSIPAGSTVDSATLTLVRVLGADTNNVDVSVYRGLTQWFEGLKNEATPDPGQDGSTWNLRNHNGSVAWAGGAGGGSGSDYAAVATATTAVGGNGSYNWAVAPDVQAWVDGTANYGWWAFGVGTYKYMGSSDNATPANRPSLVVEYTEASGGHPSMRRFGGVPSCRPMKGVW